MALLSSLYLIGDYYSGALLSPVTAGCSVESNLFGMAPVPLCINSSHRPECEGYPSALVFHLL